MHLATASLSLFALQLNAQEVFTWTQLSSPSLRLSPLLCFLDLRHLTTCRVRQERACVCSQSAARAVLCPPCFRFVTYGMSWLFLPLSLARFRIQDFPTKK